MNKFLRKSLLAILGGVFFSATAWADETTIGATDCSSSWWTVFTDPYTVAPNKTLTLQFVNHSSKNQNWSNWAVQIQNDAQNYDWLIMRADCFGLTNGEWEGRNTNNNSTNWFKINVNSYDWTSNEIFRSNLDGATVVLTIQRLDASVVLKENVTTADGTKTFWHFFAMDCESDKANDLKVRLTVDEAYIVIDNSKTTITDTTIPETKGTVIGNIDCSTPWNTAFSDYFTLGPNENLELNFKNYSNKLANWFNFKGYVTTDADRGSNEEYFVLRADNWNDKAGNNTGITSNYNWGTFPDDLDGATVKMTVTRADANVTLRADITTTTSNTYYEEFTMACGDGTQNIRVYLGTECGFLDLLPVEAEIGTTGYATFSSDYALDFSGATAGLEAYMITDHSGSVITTAKVTGTVPAGTGLLLKGTAGTYNIPIVGSSLTDVSSNLMVAGTGASVASESGKTKYVLVNNGGKAEFQKIVSTPATVLAGKAYLQFNEVISARETLFLDESDVVTSINAVEAAENNGAVYNLQGQRVERMGKGIYVKDGKKFINK